MSVLMPPRRDGPRPSWGGTRRASSLLPALLLLLGLSTVFLFRHDRSNFYRNWRHNELTANHLLLAVNRSPAHYFLGFYRHTLEADGTPAYDVYNRFPLGGYLLIKLAILPFADDLSSQLSAARILMLLFFVGTVGVAYLCLCRLTSHRWIALGATSLAFSSVFSLYYNDAVSTETGLDLFGVMLTFHGMVRFVQEGRFRQLLGKTCIALLLGWHVFGLLLPFVVWGLACEIADALSRRACLDVTLLRSRSVALGTTAVLFGLIVLSFNFSSEYLALSGEPGVTDLPSYQSMLRRLGRDEDYRAVQARYVAWPRFLRYQFHRIGGASLPFVLSAYVDTIGLKPTPWSMEGTVTGIGISCVCLVGLMFVRHKILWATLALSGFCWALPMRYSATFSEHDGVFYVGIPMVFYSLALLGVHRLSGDRLVVALSVAALLIFVLSSFKMARVGIDTEVVKFQKEIVADFEVIRRLTKGKVVFLPRKQLGRLYDGIPRYYLAGSIILFPKDRPNLTFADFVLLRERQAGPALLTPDNKHFFLYDQVPYTKQLERILQGTGMFIGRAHAGMDTVTVYLYANRLYYVRDPHPEDAIPAQPPVAGGHRTAPFFLHFIPVDEDDLPDDRKRYGFENRDFFFNEYLVTGGERVIAMRNLPTYPIAGIRTGQYVGEDRLWGAEATFDE